MSLVAFFVSFVQWIIFLIAYAASFDRSIAKVSELLLTNLEERLESKKNVNLLYIILLSGYMIVLAAFLFCIISLAIYTICLIIMLIGQYLPSIQLVLVANFFDPSNIMWVFENNTKLHITVAKVILTCMVLAILQFTHKECTSADAENLSRLQFKIILIHILSISVGILYYVFSAIKQALLRSIGTALLPAI
jgi:hypothetical protein